MDCIKCSGKTMVTNTRKRKDKSIVRHRQCLSCQERFSTTEYLLDDSLIQENRALKAMLAKMRALLNTMPTYEDADEDQMHVFIGKIHG